MHSNELIVVGASLAGLHAVRGAREAGFRGPITLLGAECHLPYDRPPLSKQHLGEEDLLPETLAKRPELEDKLGIKLVLGRPAVGLNINDKVIHLSDEEIPYGAVVIATGSDARRIPGTEMIDAVVELRTYDDAQRIRHRLRPGAKVIVIGAGLIGSEVASSAVGRGASVTLIDQEAVPLHRVAGNDVGTLIAELQGSHGIKLRLGTSVQSIDRFGDGACVTLNDGSRLEADLVVVGIGSTPATRWLAQSGLELASDQSVICDAHLRATDSVYAAGDVVTWWNNLYDARVRMENWTNAMSQGRHAGRNAIVEAQHTTSYQAVPYVWTDLHGIRLQFAGVIEDTDLEIVVPGDPVAGLVAVYRRGNAAMGIVSADQSAAMARGRRLLGQANNFDSVVNALRKAAVARAIVSTT
ncbi:NAD(P)/FAD-dependent oxidoreductase [Burkholderia diffusa]|uniref:NAD(P)/FAD-dependent oxidoreductase n=1 Tax=Burkholderia diffusa TaxID=488732 RepID=UPI0009BD7CFB|nr:FAD-dependent oxidoreductase [Burkholderia diffusa]